jgi:Putative bacterial sensory transduction regulator
MVTATADWVHGWLTDRGWERGVDRVGRVIAPIELTNDGAAAREVRVSQTTGSEPLLLFQVHSADRIAADRAGEVAAACTRWNAEHRFARVWWSQRDATLRIVVDVAVPVRVANAEVVRRAGNEVVDAATGFWRWADLHTSW